MAAQRLENWDMMLLPESIEAGIYVAWENVIRERAQKKFVNSSIQDFVYLQLSRIIEWIENPDKKFGTRPDEGRIEFLKQCFIDAVNGLEKKFGEDQTLWQYGQANYKHIFIEHPLASLVNDSLRRALNVGPAVRGGNGYTVGYTSSYLNQSAGASFRMIMDLADWDRAVGTNIPGQSGNPQSEFYRNLFEPWSKNHFFPYYYSKEKIKAVSVSHEYYIPKN
jgi:penicillin amidase